MRSSVWTSASSASLALSASMNLPPTIDAAIWAYRYSMDAVASWRSSEYFLRLSSEFFRHSTARGPGARRIARTCSGFRLRHWASISASEKSSR